MKIFAQFLLKKQGDVKFYKMKSQNIFISFLLWVSQTTSKEMGKSGTKDLTWLKKRTFFSPGFQLDYFTKTVDRKLINFE